MPYVDIGRDAMLDALTALAVYVSLHTGDPTSGGNEVSGGSPAYARQPVTHAASSGGSALQNGGDPAFDVPASTIYAVGFWSAVTAGDFYGWCPLEPGPLKPFYARASDDTFYAYDHAFIADDTVYLYEVAGNILPGGTSEGVVYYVVNVAAETFQLAATLAGAAINLTTDGGGLAQEFFPRTFSGQGILHLTATTLLLTG